MTELDDVLTPAQVVKRWRGAIKAGTLSNWRSQDKGPRFRKLGSRVVYPLSAVIEYETERTRDTRYWKLKDAPNDER